jgi:hypothetical protein
MLQTAPLLTGLIRNIHAIVIRAYLRTPVSLSSNIKAGGRLRRYFACEGTEKYRIMITVQVST